MKRTLAVILSIMLLTMMGCGDDHHNPPPAIVTNILSDAAFDGDIFRDPLTATFTVTQGNTQSVFAGIDPVSGREFRAFLDFPLSGAGGVPPNATIQSAVLDLFVNSLAPQPLTASIPVRIDLVSFQPPTLRGTDFDRTAQPALASLTLSPPISNADFGKHIFIDVTSLMIEAQRLQLPDFQVRIMEDLGFSILGLIEINDTTGGNRSTLAPLLQVTYF